MPLAVEAQSPNQWTVREVLHGVLKLGGRCGELGEGPYERVQDEKSA